MKKINILYWIFTALFAVFMLLSALPDIFSTNEAVELMTKQLGYPTYFTPFIGVAKALGAIAILIPGYPRIKEWAYAGLMFDLIGAAYSLFSIGKTIPEWGFMILPIIVGFLSYTYYHKKINKLKL